MFRKIKKIVLEYPIVIGCFLILSLMGSIVLYHYMNQSGETKVITKELGRRETMLGFEEAGDIVEYMMYALQNNDLDLALRGFTIDEKMMGQDVASVINEQKFFSIDSNIPPASAFNEYQALTSVEVVGGYVEKIDKLYELLPSMSSMKILEIKPIKPETQLTTEYVWEIKQECERQGGQYKSEYMVLLSDGESNYVMTFTLMKYNDLWKIFDFGSSLAESSSFQPIIKVNEEMYADLSGQLTEKKFWNRVDSLGKESETNKRKDSESKSIKAKIDPTEQILPPNYFVLNSAYGETPIKIMEKFILEIQKKDIVAAMNCANITNEIGGKTTTSQLLRKQSDFGNEVKRFYYGLLKADFKQRSLKEMQKNGYDIVEMLNPQYIPYLGLDTLIPVNRIDKTFEDENEYIAVYYYEGERFVGGVTFVQYENGWQIDSLSAKNVGLNSGKIKKITEREYGKIIKFQ